MPRGKYRRVVRSVAERFAEKHTRGRGCWIWNAARNVRTGYGAFGMDIDGRWTNVPAHRVAYYLHHGRWPVETDHLCRNRACVRPAHLEEVPHAENVSRGQSPTNLLSMAGVCKRGHPASESYRRKSTGSVVYCRPCRRERRK